MEDTTKDYYMLFLTFLWLLAISLLEKTAISEPKQNSINDCCQCPQEDEGNTITVYTLL